MCMLDPVAAVVAQKMKALDEISDDYFDFPETDLDGHKALKIQDVSVAGTTQIFEGMEAQFVIANLCVGDEVELEVDENSSFSDFAVKVSSGGMQFGWLSKNSFVQADVFKRLKDDQEVYARVKKIYILSDELDKLGIILDIARYAVK